jgi:hypothetical protein
MKRMTLVFCGLVLAALPSSRASADVIYTYTGNTFTTNFSGEPVDPPFTTSDSVSIWFTLPAPLGDNHVFTTITPTAYSLFDGIDTITNADGFTPSRDFRVGTDATGAISSWDIDHELPQDAPIFSAIGSFNSPLNALLDYGRHGFLDVGVIFDNPGTWTSVTTPPSTETPEPSSLLLLSSGALGLVVMILRKLSSAI